MNLVKAESLAFKFIEAELGPWLSENTAIAAIAPTMASVANPLFV